MRRRAHPRPGASGPPGDKGGRLPPSRPFQRGFTLLEMCIVLFIIALLMGAMMPAMQSAFVEQAVRKDSHQLSLMVKTAMLKSSEQHRPYVIDLTATTMSLHPVGEAPATVDAPTAVEASPTTPDGDDSAKNPAPEDLEIACQLDSPNQLLVPDPLKAGAWIAMPPTSWLFQPGDLCPATHVHMARGNAWIELSFNALTGNVENETAYFP